MEGVGSAVVAPRGHSVERFGDDAALVEGIAARFAEVLAAGGVAVAVATPTHVAALRERLTAPADARLVLLDARSMLDGLLVHGRPDAAAFERTVATLLRAAADRAGGAPVHVFGEMVGLQWEAGDESGALDLERLWNGLLADLDFTLHCAYREAPQGDAWAAVSRLHGTVTRSFPAGEASVRGARSFVRGALAAVGLACLADDAALVVSELATNVVVHAGSGFTVEVGPVAGGARLAVADASPFAPAPRRAAGAGTSGRGLLLVAAISRAWGSEPRGSGKVVWADLAAGG